MKKLLLLFTAIAIAFSLSAQQQLGTWGAGTDTVTLTGGAFTSSAFDISYGDLHQVTVSGYADSVSGYVRFKAELWFKLDPSGTTYYPTGITDTFTTGTDTYWKLQNTTPWGANSYKVKVTPLDSTQSFVISGEYATYKWID